MEAHPHPPAPGKKKNIPQTISIVVGFILFVLGAAGILYPSFAGLHLSVFNSLVLMVAGGTLMYNGFKDSDRNAFLTCLCFGIFFGFNSFMGFVFGKPGTPTVGYHGADPELLRIIPNFSELGTLDHVLNGIIAVVLLGGAIDWWSIHHERRRGNRHDRKRERFNQLAHR
ncbi:MAG: hypothetical protein ACJ76H_14300 [Bacteriovoracaceae bacterium]